MSYGPVSPVLPFLPTTQVFPEDDSQFLVKLTSVYSDIANSVNVRQIGLYDLQQLLTGQSFFTPGNPGRFRQSFRKLFTLGAIAPGGIATIAHGITGLTAFTHIYGTLVTGTGLYLPLPYVDTTNVNKQCSIYVDNTNITITNGAGNAAIASGIVVLEYLLN